jgi:hypothetical protein
MNTYDYVFRNFPVGAFAGALVPTIQFAARRISTLRLLHQKGALRQQIIAFDAFIAAMGTSPNSSDADAACRQDALRDRERAIEQLAALAAAERRRSAALLSRNALQRLLLLYPPSRAGGWALRWGFFTMIIVAVVVAIRSFLRVNYLPIRDDILIVLCACVLAALARLGTFYVERGDHST